MPIIVLSSYDFLDTINEERLIELMKTDGASNVVSLFKLNNIPLTLDKLIRYCFDGLAHWCGMYSFFTHHTNKEGHAVLVDVSYIHFKLLE